MINIPTVEELRGSIFFLLHNSFDELIAIFKSCEEYIELSNNEENDYSLYEDEIKLYIKSHENHIKKIICDIFQSLEIYVKSLIINVNYKEIIDRESIEKNDFNYCKTVDASQLMDISKKLGIEIDDEIKIYFKELRPERNSIIHRFKLTKEYEPLYLIQLILEIHSIIFKNKNWIKYRLEWMKKNPSNEINFMRSSTDDLSLNEQSLFIELSFLERKLKPKEAKKFLNFSKRNRAERKICPQCRYNFKNQMWSDDLVGGYALRTCLLSNGVFTCHVCDYSLSPKLIETKECPNQHKECEWDTGVCINCGIFDH